MCISEIDLSGLPEEVTDFIFDQFHDRIKDDDYRGQAVRKLLENEDGELDYEAQSVTFDRTIESVIMADAGREKINDMLWEVQNGHREDYSEHELKSLRRELPGN